MSLLAPTTHEIHLNTNMMILMKRSYELKCKVCAKDYHLCLLLWRMMTHKETFIISVHFLGYHKNEHKRKHRSCGISHGSIDFVKLDKILVVTPQSFFLEVYLFFISFSICDSSGHNMEKYTSICICKIMKLNYQQG